MSGFALYEITGFYRRLAEMDGQDTELDLRDALNTVQEQLDAKVENIAKLVRNLEAERNACETEAKRLQDHARALDNRVAALKAYTLDCLQTAGLSQVQAGVFKVRVQASPPSCEITGEEPLPLEFCHERVVVDVDKKAIIAALKAGREVPGAALKEGYHIRFYP